MPKMYFQISITILILITEYSYFLTIKVFTQSRNTKHNR